VLGAHPLFSIILPTRNRKQMLARAITSVRRQRCGDFELLVIDDASEGDPLDAIDLEDPRIRVLRNETSLGVAGARNIGLTAARGTYTSFLDDDDEFMEGFLTATSETLERAPREVGLSWCGVKQLDYPRGSAGGYRVRLATFPPGPRDAAASLSDLICIGTGFGVTVKTQCLRKIGGFDAALKTVEDIDLFLRIVEAGYTATAVPGVHVVVHNHRMPRLTDTAQHAVRIHECRWLLSRHAGLLETYAPVRAKLLDHMGHLQREIDHPDVEIASTGVPEEGWRGWPSMSRWAGSATAEPTH
jgi:glycosyltransferase involved in cell wall biosynthesis